LETEIVFPKKLDITVDIVSEDVLKDVCLCMWLPSTGTYDQKMNSTATKLWLMTMMILGQKTLPIE